MIKESIAERLYHRMGEIEDFFLEEAETFDVVHANADRRRRMVKYGAFGAAGLAVSVGMAAAYWKLRANRIAKSA